MCIRVSTLLKIIVLSSPRPFFENFIGGSTPPPERGHAHWYFTRLYIFFKIKLSGLPSYLFNLIPQFNHIHNTQKSDKLESFYYRKDVFKNSFFHYVIDEWNKLKPEIRNVGSYLKFRKLILNLDNGHPISNPIIYLIQ